MIVQEKRRLAKGMTVVVMLKTKEGGGDEDEMKCPDERGAQE